MRTAKKKEHRRQRRRLPNWREYTVIEDGKAVRRVFLTRLLPAFEEEVGAIECQ